MIRKRRTTNTRTDIQTWLAEIRPSHARLTDGTVALLKSLLKTQGVDFLSIEGRTKSATSSAEKCIRKSYSDPKKQLTDISGIRVITFLESQVNQIVELVRSNFEIDEDNSMDRASVLGSDKIGYRSLHFVCSMSQSRIQLPEYSGLQGLKFELQIRTVLQHAWAELAHDRSFKLGLDLPKSIQRKLNLHAGLLEIVDAAFDEIAREVDEYSASLSDRRFDQIADAEINSISLEKYLDEISKIHQFELRKKEVTTSVVEELRHFGLETIGDLVKISTSEIISSMGSASRNTTGTGFLRDILMLNDIDQYFSKKPEWGVIGIKEAAPLVAKYGAKKIAELLSDNDIALTDGDDMFFNDHDEILGNLEQQA